MFKLLGRRYFKLAIKNDFNRLTIKDQKKLIAKTKGKKFSNQEKLRILILKLSKNVFIKKNIRKALKHESLLKLEYRLNHFKFNKIEKLKNDFNQIIESNYRIDFKSNLINSINNLKIIKNEKLNWNYYSKSCKFPKKETFFDLYFNFDILKIDNNLKAIDGLVNLSISKIETELYKATWLKQGRGYNLELISGFIAINNSFSYHAKTIKKAKNGLIRKIKINIKSVNKINDDKKALYIFNSLVNKIKTPLIFNIDNFKLSIRDVHNTGACKLGIDNFINRHNIERKITLRLAINLYKKDNQIHLKRAILNKINEV